MFEGDDDLVVYDTDVQRSCSAAWLLSERASMVTVAIVPVDGGVGA